MSPLSPIRRYFILPCLCHPQHTGCSPTRLQPTKAPLMEQLRLGTPSCASGSHAIPDLTVLPTDMSPAMVTSSALLVSPPCQQPFVAGFPTGSCRRLRDPTGGPRLGAAVTQVVPLVSLRICRQRPVHSNPPHTFSPRIHKPSLQRSRPNSRPEKSEATPASANSTSRRVIGGRTLRTRRPSRLASPWRGASSR